MNSTLTIKLSPARRFVYDNAVFLADKFIAGLNFIIESERFDEKYTSEICRVLLELDDVMAAYSCEDGIMVNLWNAESEEKITDVE